jgi:N-acetylmuramic acid 6-phosphate etherase
VYGNLMVNLQPSNVKLVDRARRIIAQIAGVSYDDAARLLTESGSVRTAIVMHKLKLGRDEAERRVVEAKGRLRVALGE